MKKSCVKYNLQLSFQWAIQSVALGRFILQCFGALSSVAMYVETSFGISS